MIFNLVLLYNSGPLHFIVFRMMNLWCRSRLIKKLRQDTWTFLAWWGSGSSDTVRWIWHTPVVFVNFVPPSHACSSYPVHLNARFMLCASFRFSFIGINWLFIPYHITFKFGRGFKTFRCNRLCFLIYLFRLPRLNQWEAVRVMKHL